VAHGNSPRSCLPFMLRAPSFTYGIIRVFTYPPKWKLWVYQVGCNLGHNWLRLPISLYKIPILLMINSMLNHVALLKLSPRSPNSMLSLCHGKLPKVVAIELGEGETKFVWSMCINLAILARKVSRVMCPRLHAASTVCLELLGPDTPFFLWAFFFFWGLKFHSSCVSRC
jgi:hypothetical protein